MIKRLNVMAACLVLCAAAAFAQESMTDDEYVNVTKRERDMDAFIGFRYGLTKNLKTEGDLENAPGLAVGYNFYIQRISETLSLGPAIRGSAGFISEVKVPVYYESDLWMGRLRQVPGRYDTLRWSDGAVLMNIDGLVGYGLRFKASDYINIVAKAGISINTDVARGSYAPLWGLLGYTIDITTGSALVGIGLDAGIQIGPSKGWYIEAGGGISYSFLGMLFTTLDLIEDGKTKKSISESGNFEGQSFISIGAPYVVLGLRL